MSDRLFKSDFENIGQVCRDWWMTLAAIDPKTGEERAGGRPERGELAKLRRIGIDVFSTERVDVTAAGQLWPYRKLRGDLSRWKSRYFRGPDAEANFDQAVAVVATTLARARQESPRIKDQKTGSLLGLGKDGKAVKDGDDAAGRVMAEARFKRLIRTREWPELLDQGRRIVHLLDRNVPVADLGASLLLWNAGPQVIHRWTFAYYGADFADSSDDTTDAAA